MAKLAAASGVVIYEDGSKLYISKKPASWTSTFLFVTGLLAFILLVNGVLQYFVIDPPNGSKKAGLILFGIGVLFAIIFWRASLYRKKMAAIPFDKLERIAVIDLESNNLLDGQHHILAPIHQVYLKRRMQFGSSSPELIIEWGHGSLSIAKGNPFSGGVTAIEEVLMSKNIRKR